jgi:hypothetical protein
METFKVWIDPILKFQNINLKILKSTCIILKLLTEHLNKPQKTQNNAGISDHYRGAVQNGNILDTTVHEIFRMKGTSPAKASFTYLIRPQKGAKYAKLKTPHL